MNIPAEDQEFFDAGAYAAICWKKGSEPISEAIIAELRDWQAGFMPEPTREMEDAWLRGFMSVIERGLQVPDTAHV